MKKFFSLIGAVAISLSLVACGSSDNQTNEENVKIVVGASAVPHTEVLEAAVPLLAQQGIDLEIKTFQDYILPNQTLESGELDANYFQTPGYLAMQIEDFGYDFESIGAIHAEPIGVYSKEYRSLDELPEGAKIIMSDSFSDHGRILPIFERAGVIELDVKEGQLAQREDIVSNPKNLDFSTLVEARLLAPSFESGEGDAVVINTNYALEGDVNIDKYGIEFEGVDVLQPNLIVVRSEDVDRPELNALFEVLRSEEIVNFILEKYNGAVIPWNN